MCATPIAAESLSIGILSSCVFVPRAKPGAPRRLAGTLKRGIAYLYGSHRVCSARCVRLNADALTRTM